MIGYSYGLGLQCLALPVDIRNRIRCLKRVWRLLVHLKAYKYFPSSSHHRTIHLHFNTQTTIHSSLLRTIQPEHSNNMSPSPRILGRNGPQVNAIGLGIMSIGGVYGAAGTDEQRFALLNRAHEIGQTFLDTADCYGDTEEVIGKWFNKFGKRNDVFLATKFGIQVTSTGLTTDSSPEYVKAACNKSLARLQVDQIDLYYCHRVDAKTPIEKTVQAMVELKK
jgi:hypothetical protein